MQRRPTPRRGHGERRVDGSEASPASLIPRRLPENGRQHISKPEPEQRGDGSCPDNDDSRGWRVTNRPLFIVATALAGVALLGILFALVAAVVQQRDPTSIAVALCPVLGGAITALILQGRDSKKRGEDE